LTENEYLYDGKTFTIDPDVAAIIAESPSDAPTVPFLIDGETYFIDPRIAFESEPIFAGTPTPFLDVESQCPNGGGRLWDVAIFPGVDGVPREFVAAHEAPVGSLRWNSNLVEVFADPGTVSSKRYCSGSLISEDLFLTAAHCLDQCPERTCERSSEGCPRPCPLPDSFWVVPKIAGTSNPISRAEIATSMHVEFKYQFDPATGESESKIERFDVIELVEDQLGGLDYAILRLRNTPGLKLGATRIKPTDASQGSQLCMIGHPDGWPKQVEVGIDWFFDENYCRYRDLTTLAGSSGSAILEHPEGRLVGVHTNGGCDTAGNNYGVRIGALLKVSPKLLELSAT
jgi:hypothetical protein